MNLETAGTFVSVRDMLATNSTYCVVHVLVILYATTTSEYISPGYMYAGLFLAKHVHIL